MPRIGSINKLDIMVHLNRIQAAMLELIHATEDYMLGLGVRAWTGKTLCDFATVAISVPQRCGKTTFIGLVARGCDTVISDSDHTTRAIKSVIAENSSAHGMPRFTKSLTNLPTLCVGGRVFVDQAFWNKHFAGAGDLAVYNNIAASVSYQGTTIVLIDSPVR